MDLIPPPRPPLYNQNNQSSKSNQHQGSPASSVGNMACVCHEMGWLAGKEEGFRTGAVVVRGNDTEWTASEAVQEGNHGRDERQRDDSVRGEEEGREGDPWEKGAGAGGCR